MYEDELAAAVQAAREAGELIAGFYDRGGIAVETKADASPVTQADRDASERIVALLAAAFPGDAILSEEVPDDGRRLAARRVWIVDPLDGTRDFVARTGEFSVHVGLAVDGEAVVGAVYQPVTRKMFAARAGGGAWMEAAAGGERRALRVSARADLPDLRVGVSRLNLASALGRCLDDHGIPKLAMGASVKHMAVAAGELEAAVNLGPGEQEWDTCAPEVILREAGGAFSDGDGRAFRYNQPDLGHHRGSVASNGACHGALLEILAPHLR
ncbi:MAG: 3'(2'),5'-bisphosphate nucleotidase CysQ [Deltaproteobacteria bacterium]|nr:3'(2'),5'-bisphosphate nucleotidase CysQ [Deltaproteobacteria bacterium]